MPKLTVPRAPALPKWPKYSDMRVTEPVFQRIHEALQYPTPRAATRVRKDQGSMTDRERDAFKAAIQRLIDTRDPVDTRYNLYDRIVNIHANMGYAMHTMVDSDSPLRGTHRFLPWHRAYLHVFEATLREVDPSITIPYWDWTKDRAIPTWLEDFLPKGMRDIDGTPYDVERDEETVNRALPLPTAAEVRAILEAQRTYTGFTFHLEFSPHNFVHTWVGGQMGDPNVSPSDPLFWLHHGNIDRLWAMWQSHNPGEHPMFQPGEEVMTPWSYRYRDVTHTTYLGYRYDVEDLSPPLTDHPLLLAETVARTGVDALGAAKEKMADRVERTARQRSKAGRR